MRKLLLLGTVMFSLLGPITQPTLADNAGGVTQEAAQAVDMMTNTLSKGTFSFQFTTFREYEKDNLLLHIVHHADVLVKRPDKLSVDIDGDDGKINITYDGSKLTIVNLTQNKYVELPMTGSIETMLRTASEKFGLDFPIADFLADKPGQSILTNVIYGVKVGEVSIDGIECNHLFFAQPPGIEFELWTESGKEGLPRRVVVTYRSLPGEPQFLATLSDWQLDAESTDDDFVAHVPDDAANMAEELKQ